MRLVRHGNRILITRDQGDKRVKDESDLLYRLRNFLIANGEDVIKREMSKDGHLVSDGVYYIRSRHHGRPGTYYIYDPNYAVRDLAQEYNDTGVVDLAIYPAMEGQVDEDLRPRLLRDVLHWLPSD